MSDPSISTSTPRGPTSASPVPGSPRRSTTSPPPEDAQHARRRSSSVHSSATTAIGHPHVHRTASPILVPPPDIVSVFDPASVGGGGPLVRIATQRSQRSLARSRSHRGSAASTQRPVVPSTAADPHSPVFEDDHDSEHASPIDEKKDLGGIGGAGEEGVGGDEEENCQKCIDAAEEEMEAAAHIYPDGGYGWVVVLCCTTLCALTNGWGMNYGVFQQVSGAGG